MNSETSVQLSPSRFGSAPSWYYEMKINNTFLAVVEGSVTRQPLDAVVNAVLAAIAGALKDGGNTNVTTKELPNLNHLFQTSVTGSPSEYATIPETMAPSALKIISDWVAGQTRAK